MRADENDIQIETKNVIHIRVSHMLRDGESYYKITGLYPDAFLVTCYYDVCEKAFYSGHEREQGTEFKTLEQAKKNAMLIITKRVNSWSPGRLVLCCLVS